MILDQISYLDCLVFLLFLAPQLALHVGFFTTATWVLGASPFLVVTAFRLPYQFIRERFLTARELQTPFVRQATPFQDFVIRCVRYAFANMPAYIGRVFFSKQVSLPFLRFRMLRHGYLTCPLSWKEIRMNNCSGIWITCTDSCQPDVVVYYCHGGGFAMGSSYFYMEFLLAWVTLLKGNGFNNPSIFALEYTLVPDAVYPTQIQQTFDGYKYVLSMVDDPSRICVAGDSAGATLMLSLLLHLANQEHHSSDMPALAVMISPWVTIISENNKNTTSDYLDANSLRLYGSQYIGRKVSYYDPTVSPGECKDEARWAKASPTKGWYFLLGSEEVLAPECRSLTQRLEKAGTLVEQHEEQGSIHAWPVAALYLGESRQQRLHGLNNIVTVMKRRLLIDHPLVNGTPMAENGKLANAI